MNSSSHRHLHPGFTSLRSSITWLILAMFLIYSLYSTKLVFNKDGSPACVYAKKSLEKIVDNHPPPPKNYCCKEDSSDVISPPSCERDEIQLKDVVFCIAASANLWEQRKEYIKLWWRPGETRGVVWLDEKVKINRNEGLPDIRISGDASRYQYTNRQGRRSALRISRVVSETLRVGLKHVKWFVMGDDDTVFMVENLLTVITKYDHNQYYYIGSSSESHIQNIFFSYAIAYGGGRFAISYPLAKELEKMQDRCIQLYPGLYGSDDRIQACMEELGVPLTKEAGFHQYDVYGNLLGLLGEHPVTPLVSTSPS